MKRRDALDNAASLARERGATSEPAGAATGAFHSAAALRAAIGAPPLVSAWLSLEQVRVDQFAEATDDHQWLHVDVRRARAESPFGGPVAHGLLTLSLIPSLLEKTVPIAQRMALNYGFNRVRFPAPLPVGARLRASFAVRQLEALPDAGAQVVWEVTLEREGGDKPVCVAELITRHYF